MNENYANYGTYVRTAMVQMFAIAKDDKIRTYENLTVCTCDYGRMHSIQGCQLFRRLMREISVKMINFEGERVQNAGERTQLHLCAFFCNTLLFS